MALDIYSTAAQLKAIEILPPENRFLSDMFLNDEGCVEDFEAIYDYKKGKKGIMAPFVHYGVGGIPMERDGFQTNRIGFPNIAPERKIEENDLLGRGFGEKVIGAMDPEQRERRMLVKDLAEMRVAIANRLEWMVRQVILFGKLEIFEYTRNGRSKNATATADYGFTQFFTPSTAWDQVGADIEGDMQKIIDLVCDEGLGNVDVFVMAPDVGKAMIKNSDYIKQLDIKRLEMQQISARYIGHGLRFLGWTSDGIEMYTYSGTFINDEGVSESVIPSGTLIAGSRKMLKSLYGPVIQTESPTAQKHTVYIKKEVPLRYADIKSNAIMNRLTSRPTVMPYNVDGWCVARVL